jgi:hypothetical protein
MFWERYGRSLNGAITQKAPLHTPFGQQGLPFLPRLCLTRPLINSNALEALPFDVGFLI